MADAIGLAASIVSLIQLTGKLVTVGYGYIGGVNRARKDLRELMDEFHSLAKVLVILEDYIDTSPESTALQALVEPLQNCLEEMRKLLLELEPKGRIDCLKWPLKEKETLQRISRIERFKELFSFAIAADNIALAKSIEAHVRKTSVAVRNIEEGLQDTNTAVQGIEAAVQLTSLTIRNESVVQSSLHEQEKMRRNAEKRGVALDWLYPDDCNAAHLDISKRRQVGTGNWLLESPEFRDWEGHSKFRLLWGLGIPGAGKTYLCSLVVDHFKALESGANYGLAHIYFNYREQDQQIPARILSCLLKQLGSRISQLPNAIENLYDKLQEEKKRPTTEDLYAVLINTSKSFSRVFFVFDALDECQPEARAELLPLFQKMGKDGISIFLTSRPHPEDVQNCLSDAAKIELSAQPEDVTMYIRERIKNHQRTRNHVQKAKCEGKIISELSECAQGMFLLVRFHMDFLCEQINPKRLLNALGQIKSSSVGKQRLDATYERAIESIRRQEGGSADLAFSILSWLVTAKRTLTVNELQTAMAVEPGQYELDELNITERTTLVDVCASLVIIDELSDTIKLAHYTIQEYLVNNSTIPLDANFKLTMACTTYLTFDVFAKGSCSSSETMAERLILHPFLDYAANCLPAHLQACSEDITADLLLRFVENPGCVDSYLQVLIFDPLYNTSYDWHESQPPLHIASILGHSAAVGLLLEKGEKIGGLNSRLGTPLFVAVEAGHEAVVRLLLEKGAASDISVPDSDGETPLFVAAQWGREAVVRLLLEKGAASDISAPDNRGSSPLFVAAQGGHEAVVRLLLEKGAASDISVPDNRGRTPLFVAAQGGHEAVVRLLLEKGAASDISVPDSDGETPLFAAAQWGRGAVVRLLLEKGAASDISVPDNKGRTPLFVVAQGGHEAVVRLLLEKGAASDISVPDNKGRTPLFVAAQGGHEAVVRLLLEKGAASDISVPDNRGRTPLFVAAQRGHEAVVRLLLEKGAASDISVPDNRGRTPFFVAVEESHEAVVGLLLEKGAASDIAGPGYRGQTPVGMAISGRHEGIKNMLVRAARRELNNPRDTEILPKSA